MSYKVRFFRIHFRNQDFLRDRATKFFLMEKVKLHLGQNHRCFLTLFPHLIAVFLSHLGQRFFYYFRHIISDILNNYSIYALF
jgi:hypothetical protein